MTVSLRVAPIGRAACGPRNLRHESAPALFRLLSDSALSRAALASCGAAVAIVDAQDAHWPIAYLNPAFEHMFGYRDGEASGRPLLSLFVDRDARVQDRLLEAVRAPHVLRALHRSGEPLEVEVVMGPVHDSTGRLTHWVLTFTDRSELAQLRAELAALRSPRVA
jgi:PAS domain S-box-containing protein